MKKLSMLVAAAAMALMVAAPAQASSPTPDALVGSGQGCTGPLTFETLQVTTDWSAKALISGRKAKVTVTVTRRGPQLVAYGDAVGPRIGQPVAGARVVTVIYLSRGYRWVIGETDEQGRATLALPLPRTKTGKALAATAADFTIGPRMDCGATEVGYAEDELSIRR